MLATAIIGGVSTLAGPVIGLFNKTTTGSVTGSMYSNELNEANQTEKGAKTKKNIFIGLGVLLFLIFIIVAFKMVKKNN
jgi:ABC-type branched-subunit amino acid transport system permease subunit